jgi:3-oxoadipate enol-lactonase
MPVIDADGCPIHVAVEGPDGAPVLMLSNSLGTNLHMWDDQMPAFTRHFRVVRYDSRGHGQSGAPHGEYTIERLGRDALAVMDALGLEQVDWCGLSKGGMVGQWLGTNAPQRVGRLVLCNTAAHMAPADLWNQRIAAVTANGMAPLVESVVERWFTKAFREKAPQAVDRIRQMLLTTPPHGYAGCCAAVRDMDQRETIRSITAPTLVIGGRQDPATPLAAAELIQKRIPGARLVVLEAAHLSNIEQPAEFTAAVLEFLGK